MKQIEVVCAVIQSDNGTLLIAKRQSHIADGIWEFPGGKVEQGETNEAACIREIKEELSLHIAIDKKIIDFYDDAFEPIVHIHAYLTHIESGTISLHAHSQYAWVTPKALYQYRFQEADRILLDALQTNMDNHK